MATAITPLANITLGSTAATVTFSSISGSYRDLRLVVTYGASTNVGAYIRFNNDSASNYNYVYMSGNGSTTSSSSAAATYTYLSYANATSTTQAFITADILDYVATDKHKTVLSRGNNASVASDAFAGRWASTAAITTLVVYPDNSTFAAGSTFALYGIASA